MPVLCLGLAWSASGQAEWYYGAHVGNTEQTFFQQDPQLQNILIANPYDDAESANAYSFYGGFRPNNNFSLELGYSDLGRETLDSRPSGALLWKPGSFIADIETEGLFVSGTGSLPLGDTSSIYLRAGLFNLDMDTAANSFTSSEFGAITRPNLFYGLGADYEFNKSFGIHAEWERYNYNNSEEDVDLFSAGLKFNF